MAESALMAEDNPFFSLFETEEKAITAKETRQKEIQELNSIITKIFLFIGGDIEYSRSNDPQYVLLLPQQEGVVTFDNYERVLAERLQLKSPVNYLIVMPKGLNHGLYNKEKTIETSPILYLAHCYARIQDSVLNKKQGQQWKTAVFNKIKNKIIEMTGIMVCSTHNLMIVQTKRNPTESDFVKLYMRSVSEGSSISMDFFKQIANCQTPTNLRVIYSPILSHIYMKCADLTISSVDLHHLMDCVVIFCQNSALANLLVNSTYWLPEKQVLQTGKSFQSHTLLGRLLSPTTLAPSLMRPAEHFADLEIPIRGDIYVTRSRSLQLQLENIVSKLYQLISSLLHQGEEVREKVIVWLVECFNANKDRGKMLSRLHGVGPLLTTASDGFFINLSWLLLQLSVPFTESKTGTNPRLMSVDPGYCTLGENYDKPYVDFSQETKMANVTRDDSAEDNPSSTVLHPVIPVKFVSHCFFLTHRCLILGLTQTTHLFRDLVSAAARAQHMGLTRGPQIRTLHSQILGIKTHAMHPQLLELCLTFYTATATWLVELVKLDRPDIFPLPEQVPLKLQSIPECLVENLADFAMFLKQSGEETLENAGEQQIQLITFCTVFMGSSRLLYNPHLRAKLAHLLSLMIPDEEQEQQGLLQVAYPEVQRSLFESHSIASCYLFQSLLTIFIDIEHTGDSMEFEDKFQYRLPMYKILKFLWSIPSYQQSIQALGEQVETVQIGSMTPLFLRFINMLINDATLQLDEGLQNLKNIREVQLLKDSAEWEGLSEDVKKDHEEKLRESVMYASNRNTLALKTVNTLEMITSDITKPFVSMAMVDQIAAMLNYFLKQLVGPQSKEFIVKDPEKYNFQPRELVCSIIGIYLNLGREPAFCQAIPRDGRSFSMGLFDLALNVLKRLGKPIEMCTGLVRMREKVRQCSQQLHLEQEMMDDAPDEFLDPLMAEIMSDPVTLPTSGKTMERSVIIRHLLSDQTDPFSRQPLTADMLISNDELRQRIEEWKEQKSINKKETS